MTDAELQDWWPELGAVVSGLRQAERPAVADLVIDAVRGGATSSEILGNVGIVLRDHQRLRSKLDASGARAWDAVMADVNRNYPLRRLAYWFARLAGG